MKILFAATSADPATGGTAEAVRQWSNGLVRCGHEAQVITLDAPGPAWPGWEAPVVRGGSGRGGYGFAGSFQEWLFRHVAEYDAVIVNGLWQFTGLAARRACVRAEVPYYLFPHGMLDPWFGTAFPAKHLKKWIYWQMAEKENIRRSRAVMFTCEEERRLAAGSFEFRHPRTPVVSLGIENPPRDPAAAGNFHARFPELHGKPFFFYLGRIHEKKGVDLLLAAYAGYRERGGGSRLVIAGPLADNPHAEALRRAFAADHPQWNADVLWTGPLAGSLKWGALAAADVLVLPSHQENFGLTVVEALAAGTPVLLSRSVNIWREIVADGAGLAGEDTVAGTGALLEQWGALASPDAAAMRAAARRCFETRFELGPATDALLQLLQREGREE